MYYNSSQFIDCKLLKSTQYLQVWTNDFNWREMDTDKHKVMVS